MKDCEIPSSSHPATVPPETRFSPTGGRTACCEFQTGELYLFHPSDPRCPDTTSLWGVFDGRDACGTLRLESASTDLRRFRAGMRLTSQAYPFCRLARRDELRDYSYNLAVYEIAGRRVGSDSVGA